jgi:hypothetical protein
MFTILYTDSDKVRSAAGLDAHDVSDAMLQVIDLELLMLERLSVVLPDHENLSSDEGVERKLKLWCQYYGAWTLITNAVLAIPLKIQANTDSVQRFPVDFNLLGLNLQSNISLLEGQLNPLTVAPGAVKLFGKAGSDYDPVTGR